MKRFFTINITLFALLSLLSACGGGGGGDSSSTSKTAGDGSSPAVTTLTGTVADGYLTDAQVFLDRNNNRVYDNGEPMALSTAGGLYTLEVNPGEGDLYPVVARVIAGQTIDEDTGIAVTNGYVLESLPGRWEFISPLSTLVKLESDRNPSFSEQQGEIAVRSKFGIADSVSLFSDYINPGDVDGTLAAEFDRAHRVAQVVANIMGHLRASITQNLGGQIAVSEQLLVAYMVADQIVWQGPLIEQALNDERNQGSILDVGALTVAVSAEIDTAGLDTDRLVLYAQRVEQGLETWDMQPPQIQNQFPPANDTASIDAIVSITFDEPLDETLLGSGIVELSGPNGLVSGSLNYDIEQTRLSFTPDQLLFPFSDYQVTVNEVLADSLGNPLEEDVVWMFTTVFDQIPPSLPDF